MAATTITPALSELISSLTQEEIPAKLRCAICSRLAVNAFRLPCCDQAICETCHSTLPSSCPVCEHSPVSAADCKPNKSLRTTIKVFLRTEEKKREASRLKEEKKLSPPPTPVRAVTPSPVQAEELVATKPEISTVDQDEAEAQQQSILDSEGLKEEGQDVPQPSIEEIAPGQEPTKEGDANPATDVEAMAADGQQSVEKDENGEPINTPGAAQTLGFGATDGFPAMAFGGGDMNQLQQMQMMMAMQNGMAPNAFGGFPMLGMPGMPGMNMDPMAMQQMMMNGGFGGTGMGMNGMNMGLGMGFEGGSGAGFNNGWNGQQSWNVGQNNYNPNAAGMAHGDYGSNNSGYPQSQGYNQGNYGRGNHYNNYQNNGYARGRGRGGYGRGGGYGYGANDQAFSQQYPQQQVIANQHANGTPRDTSTALAGPLQDTPTADNVDEFGREKRQGSQAKDERSTINEGTKDDATEGKAPTENGTKLEGSNVKNGAGDVTDSGPKPIQTLDEAEAVSYHNPYGQNNFGLNHNGFNHAYHGGNYGGALQPPKPVDVPINAPTGPKAMREGLPNTGISGFKARGLSLAAARGGPAQIQTSPTPVPVMHGPASAVPETPSSVTDKKDRERSKSPARHRERSRDRERSRSREHRKSHRHRSASPLDEDEKETERRRQRRKDRQRTEGEEREGFFLPLEKSEGDSKSDRKEERKEDRKEERTRDRSRSTSRSDSKRSSHRSSRRDKDRHRERDRDDRDRHYRDRDDHRDHRSSTYRPSRRHEDRSRSRDREPRSRRSRRDSDVTKPDITNSIPPTPIEAEDPSRRHSLVSNGINGLEIKGASAKRKLAEDIIIPTGPRNTERRDLAKEPARDTSSKDKRAQEDDYHRSSRHDRGRDRDRERERDRDREKPREKERPKTSSTSNPVAAVDPHTLEREARNRERLLKEAQRIAGLSALTGGKKRTRDEDDGRDKGAKKRGAGRGHDDEARILRGEVEREGARW